MKNKKFLKSVKAVMLSMAIMATSCIPMGHPTDNTVIAEAATKIKLNKTRLTMYAGDTYQLKVSGTNKKITWSTSNKNTVTINRKGKVTARKIGKAVITAKTNNKKLKCNVTVKKKTSHNFSTKENIQIDSITISGSNSVYIGESIDLSVNILPSSIDEKNITWKSSNINIATVDNGRVYGISSGSVKISAFIGMKHASYKITVKDKNDINTEILFDSEDTVTMETNEYKRIRITANDTSNLSYKNDNTEAVTAEWTGYYDKTVRIFEIRTKKNGTAHIEIYDTDNPNLSKVLTVIVGEKSENNINISLNYQDPIFISKNNTQKLNITTDRECNLSYAIHDTTIASANWDMQNGNTFILNIQALKKGVTILTIYDSNNHEAEKNIRIIVNDIPNTDIPGEPDINTPSIPNTSNDDSVTPSAFDILYETIESKGKLNSKGNKFISYTANGWTSGIAYEKGNNTFRFVSTNYNNDTIEMSINRYGSTTTSVKCIYTDYSVMYGFISTANIILNEYTIDKDLDFSIDSLVDDEIIITESKNMSIHMVSVAITGWQLCLLTNVGITMQDIGFTNL